MHPDGTPSCWAGIVYEANADPRDLQLDRFSSTPSGHIGMVVVAHHRVYGRQARQTLQDGSSRRVTRVKDEIRAMRLAEDHVRESPSVVGDMCVGDDEHSHRDPAYRREELLLRQARDGALPHAWTEHRGDVFDLETSVLLWWHT